ncbi:hypothetical protein [Haloplanus halophilus]|uniref:hypothetical protein n=1 Tax=Haloplanus halophilus TaxID=2949993 RepID=UPI002041481F|nr:hypothetical protein [Haloplanus sp. GDY1]
MPSSRRTLLASIGAAAAGLAGCLDGGESPASPTRTSTATPTDTPADDAATLGDAVALDGVTVTVSDLVTAHSVRYLTAPDAMGVATTEGDQFAVVDASVRGEQPPAPHRFALVADGTYYGSGIEYVGPARVDAPVSGRQYDDSNPGGFLGFRVPAPLDAESVAVVLSGEGRRATDMQPEADDPAARWSVPPAAADPLRSPPPAFSASVEVPTEVSADQPIPVTLDVTNEGDGPGVFRGAINHRGPLYSAAGIDLPLSAGESATHEATIDYHVDDETPPESVRFSVVGPGIDRSVAVTVEGGGTPEGTTTGTATATGTR